MVAQQRVPIGDQEGIVGGEVALSRRAAGKPRVEACQEVVDLGRRPPTQLGPVEVMESVVAHPVRSIPRCLPAKAPPKISPQSVDILCISRIGATICPRQPAPHNEFHAPPQPRKARASGLSLLLWSFQKRGCGSASASSRSESWSASSPERPPKRRERSERRTPYQRTRSGTPAAFAASRTASSSVPTSSASPASTAERPVKTSPVASCRSRWGSIFRPASIRSRKSAKYSSTSACSFSSSFLVGRRQKAPASFSSPLLLTLTARP